MLPDEVRVKLSSALSSYKESGTSVVELSRCSKEFAEIINEAEGSLRALLGIPDNYKVLFLPGSAEGQYSAIPMNLLSAHKCADYIITGSSSREAYLEARKYGDIAIAASVGGAEPVYSAIPETDRSNFRPDADYVYMCYTNIVTGTRFNYIPDTGSIPLVADMSGFLLSEPIDVSKFGLIFASSGCSLAVPGMTVVIIRDDLIRRISPSTPTVLNYSLLSTENEWRNVPPIFEIYAAKLMFEWMLSIGGLEELKRRNERKAGMLYDFLDSSSYYTTPVDRSCRSMMVVRFKIDDSGARDERFIVEAEKAGLLNLRADDNAKEMAAAISGAMPEEGVRALIDFLIDFRDNNPDLDDFLGTNMLDLRL